MPKTDHNPDVLSCLANLSNDEVFTPPVVADQILDLLPKNIWNDKNIKFLDPVSKSGVFLRQIAKRLLIGLEKEFPDLQERIDHIFSNQIYGIAVTELTSFLSRRSVYCSRTANGKYSAASNLSTTDGNIIYTRMTHKWGIKKCKQCGASKEVYDRGADLETYAYHFIHTDTTKGFFSMKFDVIVGNPPYQLSDGGFDKSASPIYHLFIEQAIKLNPRYLTMIIPARWYSGGKGLDEFRKKMLNDERISEIHDYPETSDCFPGLNIRGGICYFLWDKQHSGDCKVFNYKNGKSNSAVRPLLEDGNEVFIRYNQAISILRKVQAKDEISFSEVVSPRKPFGIPTNIDDFQKSPSEKNNICLFRFGDNGYIDKGQIQKNIEWLDKYKVIVPKASPGGDSYPHQVLSRPIVSPPGSCCTETYIVINPCSSKKEAENVVCYLKTKFVRFLILLIKNTQNITRKVYQFVPMQEFNKLWTDEELYKKYNITAEEGDFIDTMVKSMEG